MKKVKVVCPKEVQIPEGTFSSGTVQVAFTGIQIRRIAMAEIIVHGMIHIIILEKEEDV